MKLFFSVLYVTLTMGLTRCYKTEGFYVHICSFYTHFTLFLFHIHWFKKAKICLHIKFR